MKGVWKFPYKAAFFFAKHQLSDIITASTQGILILAGWKYSHMQIHAVYMCSINMIFGVFLCDAVWIFYTKTQSKWLNKALILAAGMAAACQRGCHGDWAQSAQPSTPSLPLGVSLTLSLFTQFLLLVILSPTIGELYIIVVHGTHKSIIFRLLQNNMTLVNNIQRQESSHCPIPDERTHLQEHDSGIMPWCPDGFSPKSTIIGGEGGGPNEPRADNHILTREIIMFSSRAGQLRVSDTNVTLFSAPLPYMLRSSRASVLIACHGLCDCQRVQCPFKTSWDHGQHSSTSSDFTKRLVF